MAAYLALLSLPAVLSLMSRRQATWLALLPVLVIFTFVVGLRYKVGMDWNNYEAIHAYIGYRSLEQILTDSEPLSNALFWLSKAYTDGTLLTNVMAGFILLCGVFVYARQTPDPWLAIVAATPYLIIVVGMSGIRQAMAMGVILWVFAKWQHLGTPRRVVMIGLASLFHASAIILGIFAILDMRIRASLKILIGLPVLLIGIYFITRADLYADNLNAYNQIYISGKNSVVSPGALLHISLVMIPSTLYVLYRRGMVDFLHADSLIRYGVLGVLSLIVLYFISSTGASRMAIYFFFVPMSIYPAFVAMSPTASQLTIRVGVVVMHFAMLLAWLLLANNSHAHLPYRNLLFETL